MKKMFLVLIVALAAVAAVSAATPAVSSATFSSISLVEDGLSVALSPAARSAKVPFDLSSVTIKASTSDGGKVDQTVALAFGENDIPLTVALADGSTAIYNIVIDRDMNAGTGLASAPDSID